MPRRPEVMRVVSRHVWTCLDMSLWTCPDTVDTGAQHAAKICSGDSEWRPLALRERIAKICASPKSYYSRMFETDRLPSTDRRGPAPSCFDADAGPKISETCTHDSKRFISAGRDAPLDLSLRPSGGSCCQATFRRRHGQ